jgi:hypothetical protein
MEIASGGPPTWGDGMAVTWLVARARTAERRSEMETILAIVKIETLIIGLLCSDVLLS